MLPLLLLICLTLAGHGLHLSSNGPQSSNLSPAVKAAYEARKDCPSRGDDSEKRMQMQLQSLNMSWPVSTQPMKNLFGNAATFPEKACVIAPRVHSAYCPLSMCKKNDESVPRLFVDLIDEDEGMSMLNIIEGLLIANVNGMNFGGVVSVEKNRTFSSYNTFNNEYVMEQFFGLTDPIKLEWHGPPPCFTDEFSTVEEMEEYRSNMRDGENYYIPNVKDIPKRDYNPDFLDSAILAEVREQLAKIQLIFKEETLKVAIHINRLKKPFMANDPRNTYYFDLVRAIRVLYPDADIHAWSSKYVGDQRLWDTKDIDEFLTDDITVHLDECDLMDTWAHMSLADVFIMSPTSQSLSLMPAILNPNCVIYSQGNENRFGQLGRKHLLGNNVKGANFHDALHACIAGYQIVKPPTETTVRPTRTTTTKAATSTRTWELR